MKVNEVLMKETTTVKSVAGDKVTLDVDGNAVDTTKDALIPGAKPGTVAMKPDAAGDALKPGMTVTTDENTSEDLASMNTPGQVTQRKQSPQRIAELVRVASSGLSDPSTGQYQNMYRPEDVQRATEQLKQLGLNAQGQPLAGVQQTAPAAQYAAPGSRVGATEINESSELSHLKKLSGL